MPGRPTLRLLLVAALLVAALATVALHALGWQAQLAAAVIVAPLLGVVLARHLARPMARLAQALRHLPASGFRGAFAPLPRCGPREWETLQRSVAALARDVARHLGERDAQIAELRRQLAEATRNLEQANQELAARRFLDDLTQLPNRRALWKRLSELERAPPESYLPVQVLLCRLHNREAIMQRHGPQLVDAVLAQVAARLKRETRADDFVARLGEDEFLLLLRRCPTAVAEERAQAIRAAILAQPLRVAGQTIPLDLGIGLAEGDRHLSRPVFSRLLQAAGRAADAGIHRRARS